ncbi:hypothetical protein LMG28614_06037 [Paraburkholderia ultramafica]|uniref:Uncharacterized protein n=2 Tax=Paraburkholderia ultramafica TaxID=1544867 RepID=A0A6S7BVJ8_9BURK|nr:hypothetical protein LMG28614_06037 [Paraburkholderia ultramafica]
MTDVTKKLTKKHRVIGILHTLKQFKEAGLVEEDSMYAHEAVEDVQGEVLDTAERWYKIGAKRGAREVLKALLDGRLEIDDTGGELQVLATAMKLEWTAALNVSVGAEKQRVSKKAYALTLRDMEFDDQ